MAIMEMNKRSSMATYVHSLKMARSGSKVESEGKSIMQTKIKAQTARQITCGLEFFTLSSMCNLFNGGRGLGMTGKKTLDDRRGVG